MRRSIASTLLGYAASTYAAIQQNCPGGNICYSLNIPDATASSGSGDVYMQISGPTSYSWIAMGQGSQMKGAQIFAIYASSDGKNVTLSPRTASGHVMPTYSSATQVTLLDGSGISNGQMVANIKCSNCNSWSGGTMDFTGSSTGWIYAALAGSALNSDSTSATISQHANIYGPMNFDASAKGGNDVNPFVSSSSSSSGSSSGSGSSGASTTRKCTKSATTGSATTSGSKTTTAVSSTVANANANANPYASLYTQYGPSNHPTGRPTNIPTKRDSDDSCEDDSSSGNTVVTTSGTNSGGNAFNQFGSSAAYERQQNIMIAHGVLASLAFVILFPIGAISIRLLSFPGLVAFHAVFQTLAFVVYIVAFGMGIWLATNLGYLQEYHPVIGIILFVLLIFQPILGVLHHNNFKQYQRRTMWSHAHLWLGRIVLTLGMINGGLGFLLANNTTSGPIAYGIIAAIVWLIWVVSIVIGERRKARAASMPPAYNAAKQSDHPHSSSSNMVQHEYYGVSGPKA